MQTLLDGYYVDYADFMCMSFGYIVCNVSCACLYYCMAVKCEL